MVENGLEQVELADPRKALGRPEPRVDQHALRRSFEHSVSLPSAAVRTIADPLFRCRPIRVNPALVRGLTRTGHTVSIGQKS